MGHRHELRLIVEDRCEMPLDAGSYPLVMHYIDASDDMLRKAVELV
jgi:hypothetical protein